MLAFTGTTIDDLVILAVLFLARRRTSTPSIPRIVLGQYTGFTGILVISLAAATGLHAVPDQWIGVLGLAPIGMGARGLWRLRGADRHTWTPPASTVAGIAAVTFAGGADNITVFTPLFRGLHPTGSVLVSALFLVLTAVWCGGGALLGGHRVAPATVGRVAHWLVPAVFIAVGLLILVDSGIFAARREF